jgi:hypothetical protein
VVDDKSICASSFQKQPKGAIFFTGYLLKAVVNHPLTHSSATLGQWGRTKNTGKGESSAVSCAPSLAGARFSLSGFSVINGLNWGQLEILEETQDRLTDSGVRCVECLGGDAQLSLLLFSILIL